MSKTPAQSAQNQESRQPVKPVIDLETTYPDALIM
jgi:hypothetical protein